MSRYGAWEVALPETEAFGCVLPWNGKVCDSGATELLYGARSNRPVLSTQELEWWLTQQYHCQGNWFWGPSWGHRVAWWQAPKFPPKTTGCKDRLWYSLSPPCRNSQCDEPHFCFLPSMASTAFIHTETGLSGCGVETPNYPDIWRVLCGKP